MQLQIVRKTTKQYDRANDAEYLHYHDRLQWREGDGWKWKDVPIVDGDQSSVHAPEEGI